MDGMLTEIETNPTEAAVDESDSSGVYICKSVVNDLRHGNYICKSEDFHLHWNRVVGSCITMQQLFVQNNPNLRILQRNTMKDYISGLS